MKKLKFMLIIACITICSCSAYKSMNMSNIHIGMNEQEVINAMGRTPDNVIGAKKYKEGTFEILQYSKRLTLDTKIAVVYWLYFFNNQLVQLADQGICRMKLTACTSSDTGNEVKHVLF